MYDLTTRGEIGKQTQGQIVSETGDPFESIRIETFHMTEDVINMLQYKCELDED